MRSGIAGFAGAVAMVFEDVVYDESDDQLSETSSASSKVKAELGVPSFGLDPESVSTEWGVSINGGFFGNGASPRGSVNGLG